MKDYKTTIGGIMMGIGSTLIPIPSPEWISHLGTALLSVGAILLGVKAKDCKGGGE